MRAVLQAALALAFAGLGCAGGPPNPAAEYPRVLVDDTGHTLRGRIARPHGECLEAAEVYAGADALMSAPLNPILQAQLVNVVEGLHPIAKQVLRRTHGVWPVEHLASAAAVYLPCDYDPDTRQGGLILIDVAEFPLSSSLQDSRVPDLYWAALGSLTEHEVPLIPRPGDEGIRYILLHELGHALSLFAGEFTLDTAGRMQVHDGSRFADLSWRTMVTDRRYLPLSAGGPLVQAIVPKHALNTVEWGIALEASGGDPWLLAPGYATAAQRPRANRKAELCSVVSKLPEAGFVTPTAARYPTEDFAEMFAHAILAAEGKIAPGDTIPIAIEACNVTGLDSPYFSPALQAKRRYVEHYLGLLE